MARERRSLDILSVKKEARLTARALAEVEVGKGEEDLRCKSLFIVFARDVGDYQKMKRLGWRNIVFWMQESDYDSGYEEIRKRTNQEQSGCVSRCFRSDEQ